MAFAFPPFTVCGLDELSEHGAAGVTHVLSILDAAVPVPRDLAGYAALRQHWILRFHDVSWPIPGATLAGPGDVETLLTFGQELRDAGTGARLLLHCHAGVSRSAAAALVLLVQHHPGQEAAALDLVRRRRPVAQPNRRLVALADAALDRGGRLISVLDNGT